MDDVKRVCHRCIGEEFVKAFIKKSGESKGRCSYCRSRKKTVPVDDIAEMMNHVFQHYYHPTSEDWHYYSHRTGELAVQIIFDELEINCEMLEDDLFEILKDSYDSTSPDEYAFYDDEFLYVKISYESGMLDIAWDKMLESLKSESRFFNQGVKKFLDELFIDIDTFIDKKGQSPITVLTENSIFYRARVFDSYEHAEAALKRPEKEFGPPPSAVARSGRMNAAGIPVFYGASSPDIAIAEIRPAVGSFVIVAPFSAMRPLKVLNISAMDLISNGDQSKFNPETLMRKEKTSFLKTLSNKLTIPVLGKNPDSEYLITQAVAEYLSFSKEFKLDGLTFESTQVNKKRQGRPEHYNIVLFNKSSKVFESEDYRVKYRTELWENVEDDINIFSPKIRKVERTIKKAFSLFNHPSGYHDSVLKLKNDGMVFYSITGVVFQTQKTAIELGEAIKEEPKDGDDDELEF